MITPILSSAITKRENIHRQAIAGLASLFPFEEGNMKVNVTHLHSVPQIYTLNNIKSAILQGDTLSEPIYGNLDVTQEGKTVFKKENFLLMRIPYLTDQHTFVVDGNSYMVGSQLRTRPGIYARFRRNDVPEVSFNLAKGANFKVTMEPATLVFNMEYGASKTPLYPIIRALGFSDMDIKKFWGDKVLNSNKILGDAQSDQAVEKLYERLIPTSERGKDDSKKDKATKLRNYFINTQLDAETTKATMGIGFRNVNGLALAAAGKKLIDITSQNEEVDDRDSLEFQTINSIDDFVKERIQKGGREVVNKIKFKIKNVRTASEFDRVVPVSPFSKTIKSLVTQFSLSRTPDQINPMEILDGAMKVTRMGEGGISSPRAVPDETRELHLSHLGVLDPVRTPESHNIGVDLRATIRMAKDNEGRLYTAVRNLKTGVIEHKPTNYFKNRPLAFPSQVMTGKVSVIKDNKIMEVPASQVQYQIPHSSDMLGPSSTLIPFINNMQGNRALMGSKQVTQALPLKYREEPLVQVSAPFESVFDSMHKEMGSQIIKYAPADGKITKIDADYIHFKGTDGEKHKIQYASNLPFNSKTYLDENIIAPLGKKIKKGTQITESNYTQNGAVALGINARVAYVPYYGENSNDAIVISDSAATKFTSLHMYKEQLDVDRNTILNKQMWQTKFPNKINIGNFSKYDSNGVAAKGAILHYGEPVVLALRKVEPNQTDRLLGKLDKALRQPLRDASVIWMKEYPGTVQDVFISASRVIVTLKVEAKAQEGDKLSGHHGNKGIIGRIIPDDQMLQDEEGHPLDVLVTSAGVATRINPSQILETATGKVAKFLGKPIIVENFSGKNEIKEAQNLLKKHGVSEKETLFDPMTGRSIPNVFTGNQYMLKLFKSTDTNFAARNIGGYTIDQQPSKGGKESASRIGSMELNALLAHGTPNLLKEVSGLKSQKNDEWWQAYQRGAPTPNLKRPFVVDKFLGMLNGSQIKVTEQGNKLGFSPLTDADTLSRSHGAITDPTVLRSKDLKPEIGGLFDPSKTGGLEGQKWSHIDLDERIVKPMYKKPAASLLGLSGTALDSLTYAKGGDEVYKRLADLNMTTLKESTLHTIETGKGQNLDAAIKRYKYIEGLEKANLRPEDAYTGKTVPVVPPNMRPIVPGPNDTLLVADANHLYRDTLLINNQLKRVKAAGLPDEDIASLRDELARSVGAIVGLNDPVSRKLQQQDKKGFIKKISGSRPTEGMFQRKLVGRAQDISGRGTIAPDPTLGVDQIGLPEDTAYGMFKPMIIRNMVQKGYPAMDALKHVEERSPMSRFALEQEMANRPIIYNRAPTLHRGNMLSAYGNIVPGKTIRINPFSELSLNADFDGDAVQLQVPVGILAQKDAMKLLLSNNSFGDKNLKDLIVKPQHEAIIGIHDVLSQKPSGNTFKFRSLEEAKQAYLHGTLKANDTVEITG